MIKKGIITIIALLWLVLIIQPGCRKQYNATEVDMTDYGWTLYEGGEYLASNEWFQNAVLEDTTYKDGYNGLGWSFGKLLELDSSVYYFLGGLNYPQDLNIQTNVEHELKAGLCFAYNAKTEDSLAIIWGNQLLNDLDQLTIPTWNFSHDTTLNYLDLRLALAASYFAESQFGQSLNHVQQINAVLTPGSVFTPDTASVTGRRELADQIEHLHTLLTLP